MIFFFNDTATTEIYTLSLHDALPISSMDAIPERERMYTWEIVNADGDMTGGASLGLGPGDVKLAHAILDRKSTRLNSSHGYISYAVFCLNKYKLTTATLSPHLTVNDH